MNNSVSQEKTLECHSYTEQELAARWKISIKTLQDWRFRGFGPKFLKLGKNVRYPISEILAFEEENTVSSTSFA
jgi:hypothetical protein